MTIMFLRHPCFTSLSEGLTAHELAELINSFLTPMTEIIMEHKGTIDKYIGDAIMAFWNAPLDDPDHAKNAIVAAQHMRRKLIELNQAWAAQGHRTLQIGIGINSGECSVGNFGSNQRLNYSLLGDPVNIASRLEGLTKMYGVDLILGEETAAQARRIPPDRTRSRRRQGQGARGADLHAAAAPRRSAAVPCAPCCAAGGVSTARLAGRAGVARRPVLAAEDQMRRCTACSASGLRRCRSKRRRPTGTGCSSPRINNRVRAGDSRGLSSPEQAPAEDVFANGKECPLIWQPRAIACYFAN